MPRATNAPASRNRRRKVMKLAKGYVGGRGRLYRSARETVERGPFAHLRWALKTEDAHELYAKFGFEPPDEKFMERPPRRRDR